MTLERQLAEHAERIAQVADADLARALAADLPVLAALVDGDYAAGRVLSIAFAHLAILLEHTARLAAARPSDAVIVQTVRELGVRPAARALKMSKSAVSRIARSAVPAGTPVCLPPVEPGCTVAPVEFDVMEPGDVVVASLVHDHGVPTARHDIGDDMFGTTAKRPEIISPLPVLERLERLESLPGNAAAGAKQDADRVEIRRRLVEEREALIEALAREAVALAKRLKQAQHTLEYASGPAARAEATDLLNAALLAQGANSIGQELKPAQLAKALRASADPRIAELQAEIEHRMQVWNCYEPPIETMDLMAYRRAQASAEFRNGRLDITREGNDQTIRQVLLEGAARLKALHLYVREQLPLLPLLPEEVADKIEKVKAAFPTVPRDASMHTALPSTDYQLSKVLA